jgi:hypothetical protein
MKIVLMLNIIFIISSCSSTQNIVDNNIDEKWKEEWEKIIEKAEIYQTEQQSKIITFSDLEYTYWIPADEISERIIPWNFIFLNENLVLLLTSYYSVGISPRSLIRYAIKDNKIYFTESLKCYIDDTYLFIGDEKGGYVKYKLVYTFIFFETDLL